MEDFGSSEAGKKGGKARAKKLTKEQRSQIARQAAATRWHGEDAAEIPTAMYEGEIDFAGVLVPCAVLPGGVRVLSERGVTKGFGLKRAGSNWQTKTEDGARMPVFASAANLKPFMDDDLRMALKSPVMYRPKGGGLVAYGIRAELLPRVCDVWLKARDAERITKKKVLRPQQEPVAIQADLIIRGFAHVGIIALVDEATGYQYDRPRRDLEEQLKKFVSDSLRRWVRTFPADYFKELCRLRGVQIRDDMKLPKYFGHLTNNLVYRRLAPGLVKRLKEKRLELGSPSNKLHSWLSADVGFPEVLVHLGIVIGIMKRNTDYDTFVKELDQIAYVYPETPGLFDDPKDWETR